MIPSGRCSICAIAGGAPHPTDTHLLSMSPVWAGCWAPVSWKNPIWNFLATPGTVYIECGGPLQICPIQESHMMDSSWDLTQLRQEVKWCILRFVVLRECNQIMYISDFQFCADKNFLLVDVIPEHSSYPSKQQLNKPSKCQNQKNMEHMKFQDVLVQDTGKHVFDP